MSLQETFIENLKFYRKAGKISQKDLLIALNKGYNYINSIECGASFPPPNVIDQIAEILKIESEVLFSRKFISTPAKANNKLKFSEYLKAELTSRISKEIEQFCIDLEK